MRGDFLCTEHGRKRGTGLQKALCRVAVFRKNRLLPVILHRDLFRRRSHILHEFHIRIVVDGTAQDHQNIRLPAVDQNRFVIVIGDAAVFHGDLIRPADDRSRIAALGADQRVPCIRPAFARIALRIHPPHRS